MQARADVCLCGNHDLAVRGTIDLVEFSGDAGTAAAWTREVLNDDARGFLDGLEPAGRASGVALFHGSARDPVWEYVLSDEAAITTLMLTEEQLVLVGHSHAALQISLRDQVLEGGLAPDGTDLELSDGRWLLNPGSVGQPRDGDPHAAYLRLDTDARRASFRRVAYDIERTQSEMREVELPDALIERLALGQ
jgi:diadenosine tetraphosphatase ApaH/serine/threonine PP2A family protein phosphatase